jgi:hypothetical protein
MTQMASALPTNHQQLIALGLCALYVQMEMFPFCQSHGAIGEARYSKHGD